MSFNPKSDKKNKKKYKKAQAASGAALLIVALTVLIILYILFLPPEERQKLLGDEQGGGGGTTSSESQATFNKTVLIESIGRVDYLKTDQKDYDMPSFRIMTTKSAITVKTVASLYVKNSLFTSFSRNLTFKINPKTTNNLILSFNVNKGNDALVIFLNGKEIFYNEVNNNAQINIPNDELQENNVLVFSVNRPLWAFWKVSEYILTNLQITADFTDLSKSTAEQYFYVSEEEKNMIEKATLAFLPDCQIHEVGNLDIELNGKKSFSGIADCGVINQLILDADDINEGKNALLFTSSAGSYLIDRVSVNIKFKDYIYPVYYFELDDSLFKQKTTEKECGVIDGYCPENCDENKDRDCCFELDQYWCPLITSNINDRCVPYVYASDCGRCLSGYEDKNGDPSGNCEGLCGDDTDGKCPSGCSKFYDKDCCYTDNEDNYWCGEVPVTGLYDACNPGVTASLCQECYSGYKNGNGDRYDCPSEDVSNEEEELNSNYHIKLSMNFVDYTNKKATLIINGHKVSVDTSKIDFTKVIDAYVVSGTNSIEIVPGTTMDIAQLKITVED